MNPELSEPLISTDLDPTIFLDSNTIQINRACFP
jgi:hypothetical protein